MKAQGNGALCQSEYPFDDYAAFAWLGLGFVT